MTGQAGHNPNMRKRLVQSSRGPIEIEFSESRVHGLWVSVTPFAESGWEAKPTKGWVDEQAERG